jgi:hypothetical protein
VRATTDWIDDLKLRRWHDRDKVYAALIAALHALHDWLRRDVAIYIGACFPPLLRGLCQWRRQIVPNSGEKVYRSG